MRRIKVEEGSLPPIQQPLTTPFFTPPEAIVHYLRDVLRFQVGYLVDAFDGAGISWKCEVTNLHPFTLKYLHPVTQAVESPLPITIYQAIPKGERWEWFLEKATELGVNDIIPIETKYSVVTIPRKKVEAKLERWRKVVDNAARQSGRTRTPTIHPPRPFQHAIKEIDDHCVHFVATPYGDSLSLHNDNDKSPASVAFWVGPEGGFTEDEVNNLLEAGVHEACFGPRIMRSETAGIFAVSFAQILWGDILR